MCRGGGVRCPTIQCNVCANYVCVYVWKISSDFHEIKWKRGNPLNRANFKVSLAISCFLLSFVASFLIHHFSFLLHPSTFSRSLSVSIIFTFLLPPSLSLSRQRRSIVPTRSLITRLSLLVFRISAACSFCLALACFSFLMKHLFHILFHDFQCQLFSDGAMFTLFNWRLKTQRVYGKSCSVMCGPWRSRK